MDEAGKDIEQSTSNNPNANNMSTKLEENGTNGEHLDHCHTAGDHHDHLHHHHEQEHQHQHQHHGHGEDGGHQHQHQHHTLHLDHHHQSAEDIAAAEAHQQAANLQQQQHGAYASLTSEQLQAISSASSPAVAQAQALQHQLQQHLQHQLHQNPFPFAYQTMPSPVGVPSAHMGTNGAVGGEDPQQIKPRPKRKQVKSACLNCRKRKTGCDAYRPCTKCVRNGLEATCMDVPRKKRSSNRAKTNAAVTPLSADSSPSPSSSPALSAVAQPPPAPTFVPPQLQYMNVNLGPGVVGMPNGGLSMPPQAQYPFSVPWPGPQMVSMTWEEITKHVASAQNGGITLVPPELAWKSTGEGLVQPGVMAPGEQPK